MNILLFFILITVLAAVCIYIGKKASNNLQDKEDYFLMGRKLGLFPLAMTLLATQLGGGTLLGAAEEAYKNGLAVIFYPLGATIGLIVLGLGFGKKFRKLNISTIAEIFEKIYKSKKLRSFSSVLSIATMFFILIAQCIAARKFFISLGINSQIFFPLCWSAVVVYTVLGGLKAVIHTDILQVILILIVLGCSIFFTSYTSTPGLQVTSPVLSSSLESIPWSAWFLMPLLFMLIEQDMGQRCFASKNTKIIFPATLIAAVLLFLGSGAAIAFGTLAKVYGLEFSTNSCILIESIKILTNSTLTTFFAVAIFMAIISTADSLLCSISSNLCCDFIFSKNLKNTTKLYLSRFLTGVIGFLALGLSYFFNSVVTVLMLSYELSVCLICIPIVGALYLKAPSKKSAYFSIIFGGLSFVTLRFLKTPYPKEILSLLFSLFGFILGQSLEKLSKKNVLQRL